MLLKIREKSQGAFAWAILILICVPFALWGIQNYMGGGSETAVASVGDKEFFQPDLNKAYNQYAQSLAGMNFDENLIKKQALQKLIQDEVLFQHVENERLAVTDDTARKFIQNLEYFQTDGKFDKQKYKSLLGAQRISSVEFVKRIKKVLVMEQYQNAILNSSFATEKQIDDFFKIQNQQRDVEIISVALPKATTQPSQKEIETYYQQHQDLFLTEEQVAIAYVELSLDKLAKQVTYTEDQLKAYYQEQKDQYTTPERRKISHILFAFNKDAKDDDKQLKRAQAAKQRLKNEDFATLAAAISDDKLTAKKGGDLGLFNVGVMEKSFEDAVGSLALGEVSDPVKSAFGYHLIKVTELTPSQVKSFDEVKNQLISAYQKSQAETKFYQLGESLAEISYENPNSLQAVVDQLDLSIEKTPLFGKNVQNNPANTLSSEPAIVNAAFSEDVLKGNNSEPIELGSDKLVVLRMTEHKPADVKPIKVVKNQIIEHILRDQAGQQAQQLAEKIKADIVAGKIVDKVARQYGLSVQKLSGLTRSDGQLSWQISQAIFKAAKPIDNKPSVFIVSEPSGTQTVISLLAVKAGKITEQDKDKLQLAQSKMAEAFGQAEFNAVLQNLRANTSVRINIKE